jgi:MoaA/NifB/PqqE/SkfB family radical SAM enzyme
MTLKQLERILDQAEELGTVEWVYFEGGEPFLYYGTLLRGVRTAVDRGFAVGLVTNGYWALDEVDALEWLSPFENLINDLSISSDLYHGDDALSREAQNAHDAAISLGIPAAIISIAQPEATDAEGVTGQLPHGESGVMYRGRAAEKLVPQSQRHPWEQYTHCPHEDLRDPGRVHIDPLGNAHICQGISIGNLWRTPLKTICDEYDPDSHRIIGPLLDGGPVELVRRHRLKHDDEYADACHLCYEARCALRARCQKELTPHQMYGVTED